jgi:hypothetical protein
VRRILIGLIVLSTSGLAQAEPLVHFKLEGRRQGSADPFASNVEVSLGDVVEYRLRMQMAPLGTMNTWLNTTPPDESGRHGMNSLSVAIVEGVNDPIQVDLASPAELAPGWGFRGGIPSPRNGLWHDLFAIRPIQAPGVFKGAVEGTVLTGLFDVADVSGISGLVRAEWGSTSGGGVFYGQEFFVTGPNHPDVPPGQSSEASSDPFTQFAPLSLTLAGAPSIPEPSTVALSLVAVASLILPWACGQIRRADGSIDRE